MHKLVDTSEMKEVRTLIQQIKRAGTVMVAAQPHELVIGNMVRRVLATVREETADDGGKLRGGGAAASGDSLVGGGASLRRLLDAPDATDYSRQPVKDLRDSIHQGIQEVIEELSSSTSHIAEQAIQHIHANEVIERRAAPRASPLCDPRFPSPPRPPSPTGQCAARTLADLKLACRP
jgi:translation initiation factor eIF-2B subunit beta